MLQGSTLFRLLELAASRDIGVARCGVEVLRRLAEDDATRGARGVDVSSSIHLPPKEWDFFLRTTGGA